MGLYDRDYMRHRAPEEEWDKPVRKTKKWVIAVAIIIISVFLFSLIR